MSGGFAFWDLYCIKKREHGNKEFNEFVVMRWAHEDEIDDVAKLQMKRSGDTQYRVYNRLTKKSHIVNLD